MVISQIKNKIKNIIKNRLNSDITDGFINELLDKCRDLTEEQIIKMIDDFTLKYKYPTFTLANILEYKPINERVSNIAYLSFKQYRDAKTGEIIPYSELFKGHQDNYNAFLNSSKKYYSKEFWALLHFREYNPKTTNNIPIKIGGKGIIKNLERSIG